MRRLVGEFESDVEPPRSCAVIGVEGAQVCRFLQAQGRGLAVERHRKVARIGEGAARHQRADDGGLDVFRREYAPGAGDRDFAVASGVHAFDPMRPRGGEHLIGGHVSGFADVGRAENGNTGRGPGAVDQVAETHDVPQDDRLAFERGHRRGVGIGALSGRRAERNQRGDHRSTQHDSLLTYACCCWSGASGRSR